MILDLRVFEEFPAETTIEAKPGDLSPFDDTVIAVNEARARLAIQKSAQEYYCQGRVNARLTLECVRCLKEFSSRLEGELSFIACGEDDAARYREADDEDYVTFRGNELSVSIVEPVRQALMLALPMKPLCTEDCRGLCARCGADLNETNCDCDIETTDPRWDALKDLAPGKGKDK